MAADVRYFRHYTREMADELRNRILHAVPADLICSAEWLDAFSREGAVCVVAHEDALKACRGLTVCNL